MTEQIQIIGLTRVSRQKPNKGGAVILAYFDVEIGGMHLRGCAFVRTKAGGLVAWPPNLLDEDRRRAVSFAKDGLRHAVMMAARATYQALGGTDAEWMPRS